MARKSKIEWDERQKNFMADVGGVLRKKREYAGLTAQELGDRVGLSRPTVSGIELGQRDFLASYFDRFAEALDIDPAELIPNPQDMVRDINHAELVPTTTHDKKNAIPPAVEPSPGGG